MTQPPPSRDSDEYWANPRPDDHNEKGLFIGGPAGDSCALGRVVGDQHCAVSAASPDGERKRRVVYRGRTAAARAELEAPAPELPKTPRMVRIGNFWAPAKPGNSGRKRKRT